MGDAKRRKALGLGPQYLWHSAEYAAQMIAEKDEAGYWQIEPVLNPVRFKLAFIESKRETLPGLKRMIETCKPGHRILLFIGEKQSAAIESPASEVLSALKGACHENA